MKYIECPKEYLPNNEEKSLFIAGGISNCRNWQRELVEEIVHEDVVLFNPRRKLFDINNPEIEIEQINWEHKYIGLAKAVSFWFSPETLCPITLYELGKVSMMDKKLFIGIDEKYSRKRDLKIQTGLIRPEVEIVYSLEDLSRQIKDWGRS